MTDTVIYMQVILVAVITMDCDNFVAKLSPIIGYLADTSEYERNEHSR